MKFKNSNHFKNERKRKADSFNNRTADRIFIAVIIMVIGSILYYFIHNPLY